MFRLIASLCILKFATAVAVAAATERQYLSGRGSDDPVRWDFFCTEGRNSGVWTRIDVPSCWELQGFGNFDYGVEFRPSQRMPERLRQPQEEGIYRRTFHVPSAWRDRAVDIVFGGVLTDADVKINGVPAGAPHQGGFYRFRYAIGGLLRFDAPNEIEVRVSKRSANASVNRAERFADYWNFGGILRPVWLEAKPVQYLERIAIDAKADGRFYADVFLGGGISAGREVAAQIETIEGKNIGAPVVVAVPAGASRVAVKTQVSQPAMWTAETPNLYRVTVTLRGGDAATPAHTLTERFGFRTFELRPGDGLYLNGSKITLKGVNRHSFWPETGRTLSHERNREDVRLMKEANLNAVRMSHYPPDPEFLDLCDEMGLYVLNELGGWQASYDTPTGRRLIVSLVTRDVNHPSILFWDNGNEGGENTENDDEFAKHDPQQRPVLHPWAHSFRGMNTRHYREYEETKRFAEGPEIFMPTEFLHGLFDGGAGAGLDDFWKIMGERPHAAGGFLWDWADEAVRRDDLGGKLDPVRDLGADGIVGPHHEKEGSFFTIREIWSPVQVPLAELPADFAGELPVRNRYDFLNLETVTFEWRLMKFAPPGALLFHRTLLAHGRFQGPDLPARADGKLRVPLPADWREADVLSLAAFDDRQRELWTWSWQWKSDVAAIGHASSSESAVSFVDHERELLVVVGRNAVRFDKTTGRLAGLERDGRRISLANGPRLVAYRRVERSFVPVELPTAKLLRFDTARAGDAVTVTARYEGALREVRWTISPDGDVRLDYEMEGPGSVDILGVDFDYPEEKMRSKEWLGGGPYRVWQNRLKGTQLGRWDFPYNDPIPGVSWEQPEFKGWFSGWRWIAFTTTEGRFVFLNGGGQPYVGVYSPRDGKNNPVLPRLGLGVYQAITGIGTKGSKPDALGPQGQPKTFSGPVRSSLVIRLLDRP